MNIGETGNIKISGTNDEYLNWEATIWLDMKVPIKKKIVVIFIRPNEEWSAGKKIDYYFQSVLTGWKI